MRLKASTQVLNCDARDSTLLRTWALVKVGGVGGGVVGGGVAAPLAAIAGRRGGEERALWSQAGGRVGSEIRVEECESEGYCVERGEVIVNEGNDDKNRDSSSNVKMIELWTGSSS